MLVSQSLGVMETLLNQFKPVFSKPQFRNFFTYILGLIASEGRKTIDNINSSFTDHKNQSTLNRFLTESP